MLARTLSLNLFFPARDFHLLWLIVSLYLRSFTSLSFLFLFYEKEGEQRIRQKRERKRQCRENLCCSTSFPVSKLFLSLAYPTITVWIVCRGTSFSFFHKLNRTLSSRSKHIQFRKKHGVWIPFLIKRVFHKIILLVGLGAHSACTFYDLDN